MTAERADSCVLQGVEIRAIHTEISRVTTRHRAGAMRDVIEDPLSQEA